MSLHDRREEGVEERRESGPGATLYQMRQKLLSIGDDYWIEDADGRHVYRVDGKVLQLRTTLDLEDLHGARLCRVRARIMHAHDTMDVEGPDGHRWARVHKAPRPGEEWKVDVESGPDMHVGGDIVDHEYEIAVEGRTIAEVSKKWFGDRDIYGVEIASDQDPVLVLAVTLA